MNILVCVKQVPDTTAVKIDPVTNTLIRDGVPSILNPFDGFALEMALRMKEAAGGTVTVVSMGPAQAAAVLRDSLAVGADDAFLVSGREFGGSDTLATSYILSRTVKTIEERKGVKFDAIFCGKQALKWQNIWTTRRSPMQQNWFPARTVSSASARRPQMAMMSWRRHCLW